MDNEEESSNNGSIIRPLILGLQTLKLTPNDLMMVTDLRPAGFILFDRNIQDPEQVRFLTDSLRKICGYKPLIAIDQEGGMVSRLEKIIGPTPSAAQLGYFNKVSVTRYAGKLTGDLLSMLGINWNLAPVLDIAGDSQADNSLKGRCFGKTPDRVAMHAGAFVDGLHDAGILCCAKHFPGMGDADADPHHGRSVANRTRAKIHAFDIVPFQKISNKLDAVMLSHTVYPDITDATPASLSPHIGRDMVAKLKNFKGLVITDDLDMGAVAHSKPEETFEWAMNAGNDLLLVCHQTGKVIPEIVPYAINLKMCPRPRDSKDLDMDRFTRTAKELNNLCG